jgi:hypothetical protein
MPRLQLVLSLLLILVGPGPVTAGPDEIHCPAEPPVVRRFSLQEAWRIDPYDAEAPLMGYFGPSQVVVHDGRVYMMDLQLCHVLVYDDRGEFQGTIMREGEGPGEVRQPGAMFFCADGRLAVQHGYPTKLEFVDLDGTPRGRWQIASNAWINRLQETPRGWFGVYTESKQSDDPGAWKSVMYVALHDDEGERTASFFSKTKERNPGATVRSDEAAEYNPWYTAAFIGEDEVVIPAARDAYRLEWRNLAGAVTRVVNRDFAAHERTPAELDRLKYTNYSMSNGQIRFEDRTLCARDPMISTLEPQPDGSLRVRTSLFEKDLPDGMVCRYEVHGPAGELRERVEIHDPSGAYDVDYDQIALLADGRAMILRNLRPTWQAAINPRLHPELQEKLPPLPDDREDMAFTPIMCELVPLEDAGAPAR